MKSYSTKTAKQITYTVILLLFLLPTGARAQFAWYGQDGKAQVETGFGDDTHTQGIWWVRTDNDEGGHSQVVWGAPVDSDGRPGDEIVAIMDGIGGSAALDKNDLAYDPWVEIGFDVAGVGQDGSRIAVDASSWGGIGIAYTCDAPTTLILGLEDAVEKSIMKANPFVNLPKSTARHFQRFPWSDFLQPSWYSGKLKIDGPTAATQLAYIAFRIQAVPGSYQFNIIAIGSYDMPEPPKESSGIRDAGNQMQVQVRSENGVVTIHGVAEGTPVSLYGTDGRKLGHTIAGNGSASINTSHKSGTVGIIRIGDRTVKEVVR